jgi:hypothetical protein
LIALIIDAHRPTGAFCSPVRPVTDPIIHRRPLNSAGERRSFQDLSNHTKHVLSDTGAVKRRQAIAPEPPGFPDTPAATTRTRPLSGTGPSGHAFSSR